MPVLVLMLETALLGPRREAAVPTTSVAGALLLTLEVILMAILMALHTTLALVVMLAHAALVLVVVRVQAAFSLAFVSAELAGGLVLVFGFLNCSLDLLLCGLAVVFEGFAIFLGRRATYCRCQSGIFAR